MTFYDFSGPTLAGDTISMGIYSGKKMMVINCASYCVYTPQYTPLEQLYTQYKQYNFSLIGYPTNDFAHQGGTDSQIIATCSHYAVDFQIMGLVNVAVGDTAPLFKWLQRGDLNGVSDAHIDWNFNKFLIDAQGHWVRHYPSTTSPLDTSIINWIMEGAATGISPIKEENLVALRSSNPGVNSIDLEVMTPSPQHYNIQLFSIDGRLVSTLYNGNATDAQFINYPAAHLSSGNYLIRIQSETGVQTIKYTLQH